MIKYWYDFTFRLGNRGVRSGAVVATSFNDAIRKIEEGHPDEANNPRISLWLKRAALYTVETI